MKVEYTPLLSLGFHTKTLKELRDLCVNAFPTSRSRTIIMDVLDEIVSELIDKKVEGEVWVDGSFVTEKPEPEDSDILLYFSGEFFDNGTPEQRNLIKAIGDNLKADFLCDSYILSYYPQGHEWYNELEWWKAYWIRQFGFSREDKPKGIAVIKL